MQHGKEGALVWRAAQEGLARHTRPLRFRMADPLEARQVTVRLSTQLPAALRVPATALAVPAALTRYGLSEVVNSMLSLGAHWRGLVGRSRVRARGVRRRR